MNSRSLTRLSSSRLSLSWEKMVLTNRTPPHWPTISGDLVSKWKSVGEKVICSTCGGVFWKAFFTGTLRIAAKHLSCLHPEAVAVTNVRGAEAVHDTYWANMLAEKNSDAIFEVVMADPTILRLGKSIFDERKPTKEKDARIKARSGMSRMARLLQLAKGIETVADLLDVSNFYILQEAIVEMCIEGGKAKPGLKVAVGSLIKKAAKGLVTDLYVANRQLEAAQVDIFQKVFQLTTSRCFAPPNTSWRRRGRATTISRRHCTTRKI